VVEAAQGELAGRRLRLLPQDHHPLEVRSEMDMLGLRIAIEEEVDDLVNGILFAEDGVVVGSEIIRIIDLAGAQIMEGEEGSRQGSIEMRRGVETSAMGEAVEHIVIIRTD
jgi:hypothetical protein